MNGDNRYVADCFPGQSFEFADVNMGKPEQRLDIVLVTLVKTTKLRDGHIQRAGDMVKLALLAAERLLDSELIAKGGVWRIEP